MIRRALIAPIAVPALIALGACASTRVPSVGSDFNRETSAGVEEVFILRTARSEHTRSPTPACAAASFPVVSDDVYQLWSMEQRSSDGRVTDTHRQSPGSFRACIGALAEGRALPMYAMFDVGGIAYTGVGECLLTKTPPPVKALLPLNCILNLGDLPPEYVGGNLVSSTLAPVLGRDQPVDAHIPGYLCTSVVTIRLWKRPK